MIDAESLAAGLIAAAELLRRQQPQADGALTPNLGLPFSLPGIGRPGRLAISAVTIPNTDRTTRLLDANTQRRKLAIYNPDAAQVFLLTPTPELLPVVSWAAVRLGGVRVAGGVVFADEWPYCHTGAWYAQYADPAALPAAARTLIVMEWAPAEGE